MSKDPVAKPSATTAECDKAETKTKPEIQTGPKVENKEKARREKNKFSFPFGKSKSSGDGKVKTGADPPKKKYTLKDRFKDIRDGFAEISKSFKDKRGSKKQHQSGASRATVGLGNGSDRRMVFPYTFTAKIAQFPYRYYFDNVWLFKYFIYGAAVSLPVFIYIQRLSYTPRNVEIWRKKREELFSPHHRD